MTDLLIVLELKLYINVYKCILKYFFKIPNLFFYEVCVCVCDYVRVYFLFIIKALSASENNPV